MWLHVQLVSSLSQTSLLPFFPHDPSANCKATVGGCLDRYSPPVVSAMGRSSLEKIRATCSSHIGPSNHQWPKSSASNNDAMTGGSCRSNPLFRDEYTSATKCSAWMRVRACASSGQYGCFDAMSDCANVTCQYRCPPGQRFLWKSR